MQACSGAEPPHEITFGDRFSSPKQFAHVLDGFANGGYFVAHFSPHGDRPGDLVRLVGSIFQEAMNLKVLAFFPRLNFGRKVIDLRGDKK